ncbi:hypothetical protein GYMLUDRAFT_241117 [Collybiopsis luxurians FD-317 M1]|nr:hypothetical protein GYMLUDRAFT_241117 [Collybiopsis luxurians FD-317 M1]
MGERIRDGIIHWRASYGVKEQRNKAEHLITPHHLVFTCPAPRRFLYPTPSILTLEVFTPYISRHAWGTRHLQIPQKPEHLISPPSSPFWPPRLRSSPPSGKFLAAAGYGGVYIWALDKFQQVSIAEKPGRPNVSDLPVYMAVKWIFFEQGARHVLVVGSIKGTLELWDYREGQSIFESSRPSLTHPTNEQVVSIDISQAQVALGHRTLVAISYGDRTIALYTLNCDGKLKSRFSVKMPGDFLPKTVCFDPVSSSIYAFAFYGGSIALLDSSGNVVWQKKDGPKTMASVSIDLPSNSFALCGDSTFELFKLDPVSPICALAGPPPNYSLPKQVAFLENGSKVIVGLSQIPHITL